VAVARTEFVATGQEEVLNSVREQIRALEDLLRVGKLTDAQAAVARGKILELRRASQDLRREFTDTSQRASALTAQFGVAMPTALQKLILQSAAARTAVNAIFHVGAAVTFGGAIAAITVKAVTFFNEFRKGGEAVQDFNKWIAQTNREVRTTAIRFAQANEAQLTFSINLLRRNRDAIRGDLAALDQLLGGEIRQQEQMRDAPKGPFSVFAQAGIALRNQAEVNKLLQQRKPLLEEELRITKEIADQEEERRRLVEEQFEKAKLGLENQIRQQGLEGVKLLMARAEATKAEIAATKTLTDAQKETLKGLVDQLAVAQRILLVRKQWSDLAERVHFVRAGTRSVLGEPTLLRRGESDIASRIMTVETGQSRPSLLRGGETSVAQQFAASDRLAGVRGVAEETRRIEEAAAMASVNPWARSYAQIIQSAQQRQREVEELLRRREIAEGDAARRITAIWQEATALQRDALSDTLQEFASGPMEFFQRRWKEMLFRMLADTILASKSLRNIFGSILGVPLGQQQGGGGSLLTGLGVPGFGGGFGSAAAPGGTGGFVPGTVIGNVAGPGPLGFLGLGNAPALPVGAVQGQGAIANQDLLTKVRGFFGAGPMSKGGAILNGLLGIGGMFLSGSSNRGLSAAGGALTGAAIGGSFFPVVGHIVGAIVGGLIGFFGGKNYGKLRDRFLRDQFRPAVDRVIDAYNLHQLDYGSAIAQLEQLRQSGVDQLRSLKGDGSRAHTVIDEAIRKIKETEGARQSALQRIGGLPAPEFARGGFVSGAMGQPVPVLAHGGEAILNLQQQSMVGTQRIQEVFRQTGASRKPRGGSFASGGYVGGEGYHVTIQVMDDPKGFERVLQSNASGFVRFVRKVARDGGRKAPF